MIYYSSLMYCNKYSLALNYLKYIAQTLLLSFVLLSCRAVDEELVMSVSEEKVSEYALAPNSSHLAVVVPVGKFTYQSVWERTRIRILDVDTKDTIAQLPDPLSLYFDSLPVGLNWITDTELMFQQRGEIMLWDINTEEATIFPVPFGGFSTSHQTREIALWKISNDRNFQFNVDIDIYTYPDGVKTKTISILEDTPIEIVDVVWSSDDKYLLLITTLSPANQGYIYQIDLSTENVTKLATIDSLLLPSDEVAWNSIDNWIAISRAGTIKLFSITEQCFFEEYAGNFNEPLWTSLGLFALKSSETIVKLNFKNLANDKTQCLPPR